MFKALVVSIRPRQWYKNLLLFVGIIFSANLLNASMWATVLLGFVYFCMLSAGQYLLNDVMDRERDRKHPIKRLRPIASGQLKAAHALSIAVLFIVVALAGAYFTINLSFLIISASYVALAILYSLFLKHAVIVDVLVVSVGFVIRAVAGALAISVVVSPWLVVCTFLLALFLALEKRWYEMSLLSDQAESHRPNLAEYSPRMLEQLVGVTTAALIVSYLLYTVFSAETDAMLATAPLAIYGLFRYLLLVHDKGWAADPEVVFKDKPMLINLALWGLIVVSIMLYEIWH
jgi:4-hydroxybenzoate polyprenyltransferase